MDFVSLLFLIAIIILLCWLFSLFKTPKCGNLTLITGGLKTGKSLLTVHTAYWEWKMARLRVRIFNFLCTVFGKISKRFKVKKPLPLFYSNVPLAIPYVPLTQDLLERRERFVYGSIVYICECSLVADSMTFNDVYLNENLLLFVKLFAHETKGGKLFLDTQSILDNHYAIKRCLSTYLYIHHNVKIPFFCLLFCREMKFDEDGHNVNTFDEDVEAKLKICIVPKSAWKRYDRYTYSILTDHLPVNDKVVDFKKLKDLKARDIITFKEHTKDIMYGGSSREKFEEKLIKKKIKWGKKHV